MEQFALFDPIASRDAAMEAVIASAGADWCDRALALFVAHAKAHAEFMTEDVRRAADAAGLPNPPDGRAWGGITARALREGVIVATGRYRQTRYTCNAHKKPIWKSLSCVP